MTHIQTLGIVEIPFQRLVLSDQNVRTTPADENAIRELAASIQSVGLLHSLVVQQASRGKVSIIAGSRRYAALALLVRDGTIKTSYKVPCRILPAEADATEVSLAENIERESMQPVDECSAFQKLINKGNSCADIAARFGYTELLIERRLALTRLSPFLLDQYRKGKATLELLQAFTLSSNHAQQENVWQTLPDWNRNPAQVRRLLAQKDIPASDGQVQFVTLAAYEAAGGRTKRDLFADEKGNGVYLLDADILACLVAEKLEGTAAAMKAEGWNWCEIQPEADYQALFRFRRMPGEPGPLPKKLEKKRAQLAAEFETLSSQLDGNEEETEECEELYERIQTIETEIDQIDNSRTPVYPDHTKQICGVILSLDERGNVRYDRGLLRKEDENSLRGALPEGSDSDDKRNEENSQQADAPTYSSSLIESLTTIKTAAIGAELAQQPGIALSTVVYTLLSSEFAFELSDYRSPSALQISRKVTSFREAEQSASAIALAEARQEILAQLPRESGQLWHWCLGQSQESLLRLLAYCAATAVYAIQTKNETPAHLRLRHADELAQALKLDMSRWFKPTTDTFFSRVSKVQIGEALAEAGKPADAAKLALKKAQLASAAEADIAGTGWLPAPIRIRKAQE